MGPFSSLGRAELSQRSAIRSPGWVPDPLQGKRERVEFALKLPGPHAREAPRNPHRASAFASAWMGSTPFSQRCDLNPLPDYFIIGKALNTRFSLRHFFVYTLSSLSSFFFFPIYPLCWFHCVFVSTTITFWICMTLSYPFSY